KQLLAKYEIDVDHLIVIHDEIDLDGQTIRVKFGGGHAGHNGLRSIIDKLCTADWYRVRVGVGRGNEHASVADYVLSSPKGSDDEAFKDALDRAAKAALSLVDEGLIKTQQTFN
ncbi:MAG: aminoacyl-tRNA hydrolase, partial [Eggerthellaceae bacterium]|nr:aminoacyl-tRNA hydrolase [Eggerthellaceae bacterium]